MIRARVSVTSRARAEDISRTVTSSLRAADISRAVRLGSSLRAARDGSRASRVAIRPPREHTSSLHTVSRPVHRKRQPVQRTRQP